GARGSRFNALARTDIPDLVARDFGEPHILVGADGYPEGATIRRADGEFGEDSEWRHPADRVVEDLREPQVPVGAGRDFVASTVTREFGEDPQGSDTADLAAALGEPQVPVGAGRDADGATVRRREG